jgi:hypothetical protein
MNHEKAWRVRRAVTAGLTSIETWQMADGWMQRAKAVLAFQEVVIEWRDSPPRGGLILRDPT